MILTYDEFSDDPSQTLAKIMNFLNVPNEEILSSDRINETYISRHLIVRRLIAIKNILGLNTSRLKVTLYIKRLIYSKKKNSYFVEDRVKKIIDNLFFKDIQRLESILGVNLSTWKNSSL